MNTVVDMWRFAEAAAHKEGCRQFEPIKSAIKFIQTKTDESYSYIAQFSTRSIIAFMGTDDNLKSWILNFSAYPLKGDDQIQHFKDSLIHTVTKEKGIIHNGFYTIWEKSKPMVDDFISSLPSDHKIIVTGMSQGGSVATICARHLAKNRKIIPTLISFAAPAQGTIEYATQVDNLLETNYRVVNMYDIVPTLPPIEAGFVHSGLKLELYSPWWHKYFRKIRDHFYSAYTKNMLKRFLNPEDQEVLKEILKRVCF